MKSYEFSDSSRLSFKGCPNQCYAGKYPDLYKHKYVECEYCANIRKKLLLNDEDVEYKDLDEILRTKGTAHGDSFISDGVISKSVKEQLTSQQKVQFEKIKSLMEDTVSKYNAGTLPDKSYVISLGRRCNLMDFHVECLKKGYIAGLTIVPYCTVDEIIRIIQNRLLPDDAEYLTPYVNERDLYNNQVCVIQLKGNLTRNDIDSIFGLVSYRGQRKLPTIIVTDCNASETDTGKFIMDNATICESEANWEIPLAISIIPDEPAKDIGSLNNSSPLNLLKH